MARAAQTGHVTCRYNSGFDDAAQSAAGRVGRSRLESDPPADGCGKDAQRPTARRERGDGADRDAAPATFADAVDFHCHREAAIPAWHSWIFGADSGRTGYPARHQSFAARQSPLEHPEPERSAKRGDRLVAESPG